MKRVGILALFVIALPGIAQVPLIPPPDTDPFVGTWLKNRDKSQPITNGAYVLVESYHSETISREGDDLVVSTRRGPSEWSPGGFETGLMTKIDYRFRCDGNSHRLPFGSTVCKYTSPNVMEGKTKYDRFDLLQKHETFFWRREISTDGKEMKDLSYKDAGMKRLDFVSVFDRVK